MSVQSALRHRRTRRALLATCLATAAGLAGSVAVTPAASAAAGCRVTYQVTSQWPGGFGADVTVTNLGDAISGWTLSWTFPAGQTIGQLWNGVVTSPGPAAAVTNQSYNGALATGASAAFGFNGTWSGSNPVPTSFSVNGTVCGGPVVTTTTTTTRPATTTTTRPTTTTTTTTRPTTTTTTRPTTTTTTRPSTTTTTSTTTTSTTTSTGSGGGNGSVGVTVNATAGLGTVPGNGLGLNTAVYDSNMNHPDMPGLLKAAGFNALRYPGGSYGDIYHWQTHTTDGGYVAGGTTFAEFMATAKATGADPIIIANYGTGTAEEAAGWVKHANVDNGYGITYWEIGNETAGNGTYGANWEADRRCTDAAGAPIPSGTSPNQTYNCGPAVYAAESLRYIAAMKAVDPRIKVCVQITTPGAWPDGVTNAQSPKSWNETVLTAIGARTDCVIIHWYPAGFPATTDINAALAFPNQIAGMVSAAKAQVRQYAGLDPSKVQIMVTETNGNVGVDVQPNALFAADSYLTWFENGAQNVDWWNQHNGPGTPSIVNGAQDYGDGGLFSSGTNGSGVSEPPLNTPFAPYYGIAQVSRLASPGDTMVGATSGNPLVKVHAVRKANGGLAVMILNEDIDNAHQVNLTYSGFTPSGPATVHTFANNASSITTATGGSTSSITVGRFSITVLQLPGSGGTVASVPGPPGAPTVTGLSSSTGGNDTGKATLGWAAAAPGTYPIANYQVYRLDGSARTLVASPAGTSLSLSGLTIGTSYRYEVVAVDTHGLVSLPTSPVTVTVPPPADSSCAVHWDNSNSWAGGFVANVTVTNRAATAVADWRLTWTWPADGQAVGNSWGATLTQTGRAATAAGTGAIAANGGTGGFGFQGSFTGANPAPAAFFLNGTACANS